MERLRISLPGRSVPAYDPAVHANMKADSFNRIQGDLTGMDCPKCRNKGCIAYPQADGNIRTASCGCMKIRKCIWQMEHSGLQKSIRNLTFEHFRAEEPWQKQALAKAREYAEAPNGWLLLAGQSGCGKTHLCTAVCRQLLLSGQEVRYMPWREEAGQLKAMRLDSSERETMLANLKKAENLYIDDLFKVGRDKDGSCNPTGADISLAFEILNHRYINRLPTLISTERMPEELVEIDEGVASRILEMAGSHIYAIEKNRSRNYRLRNVQIL